MTVNLNSVAKLFSTAPTFETMTPRQQAAFRATLTRYRNEVTDPDILSELAELQIMIGESETKARDKVTVEDVESEYPDFAEYDTRQRAGYKSKLTKMLNEATEAGDISNANRLSHLISAVASFERQEAKDRIMSLARKLRA